MIKHQMIFKKIVHVINNNIVKNNLFPYNIVSISQNIVLQYEPNNATAKEFYPLILEKLRAGKWADE